MFRSINPKNYLMKIFSLLVLLLNLMSCAPPTPEGDIFVNRTTTNSTEILGNVTTFAGKAVYAGDDGPLKDAGISISLGMAIDNLNNLIVADSANHLIRKITPAGVVTTIAGLAGVAGSDDGTGSAAKFHNPVGIAIDSAGNIFVADSYNHTIRKIDATTLEVTTFAGTAGAYGSANGIGLTARFNNPFGIAIDSSDNLFVTDQSNYTIRKIRPDRFVSTFAGSTGVVGLTDGTGSSARFGSLFGIAIDNSDNLYVGDNGSYTIRKVTSLGVVTTFAGTTGISGSADGTGTAASFSFYQYGLTVDSSGNILVTDYVNHTIRKITQAGVVTTIAGTAGVDGSDDGTGSAARFFYPQGIAIDSSDNLFVVDTNNYIIRKITPAGVVTTFAGTLGTQGIVDDTGLAAAFYQPQDLTVDQDGNIFVTDFNNDDQYPYIRKITPVGVVTTVAGGDRGFADGPGLSATFGGTSLGITSDKAGNLYIADTDNHLIRKIDSSFNVTTMAGSPTQQYGRDDGMGTAATFRGPLGLAVDPAGYLYVADTENRTIRKID
jgi:sugar lactone lactonase YvrE